MRVQRIHAFEVAGVVVHDAQPGEERHRHLQCVDPGPVVARAARDHRGDAGVEIPKAFRTRIQLVEIEIRLAGALIVGEARRGPAREPPRVAVGPTGGVVHVARLGAHGVEGHEALEVDGARPRVARHRRDDLDVVARSRPQAENAIVHERHGADDLRAHDRRIGRRKRGRRDLVRGPRCRTTRSREETEAESDQSASHMMDTARVRPEFSPCRIAP